MPVKIGMTGISALSGISNGGGGNGNGGSGPGSGGAAICAALYYRNEAYA